MPYLFVNKLPRHDRQLCSPKNRQDVQEKERLTTPSKVGIKPCILKSNHKRCGKVYNIGNRLNTR